MRRIVALVVVFSGCLMVVAADARAGGYYYRPRSFYVTPPIYANLPVFGQPPIVYYEPVITVPAPVAGYYVPLSEPVPAAAPVSGAIDAGRAARVRERQISTPLRTRHQYDVVYPNGSEYQYRYRRTGGRVRFTEQWVN